MSAWLLALLAGCAPEASSPVDTDLPVDTTPTGPPGVLAVDNGKMQLLRISDDGEVVWSAQTGLFPRDLAVVDDRVLVSSATGAVWHDLQTGEQTGEISGLLDVQSAQVLPSGDVRLAAQDGDAVVVVDVNPGGVETGRITIPASTDLRLLRTLSNGHLLFTASDPYRVVEADADGVVVWTAPLPGKGYLALRADDGTTWATTGEDLRVVHLDADGAEIGALGGQTDLGLDWLSGFARSPDGSTTVANWLGHNAWGAGPHLVRFDDDNQVVWTWEDHEAAMQITHVLRLP